MVSVTTSSSPVVSILATSSTVDNRSTRRSGRVDPKPIKEEEVSPSPTPEPRRATLRERKKRNNPDDMSDVEDWEEEEVLMSNKKRRGKEEEVKHAVEVVEEADPELPVESVQQCLPILLDIVLKCDKRQLLTKYGNDVTGELIQQRVGQGEYTTFRAFLGDLDAIVVELLKKQRRQDVLYKGAKQLRGIYVRLVERETERILKEMGDTTTQIKSKQRFALFQRGVENFLFSNTYELLPGETGFEITGDVKPLAVFPYVAKVTPASLGHVAKGFIPFRRTEPEKPDKNFSTVPYKVLAYDSLTSFAPYMDTGNATISAATCAHFLADDEEVEIQEDEATQVVNGTHDEDVVPMQVDAAPVDPSVQNVVDQLSKLNIHIQDVECLALYMDDMLQYSSDMDAFIQDNSELLLSMNDLQNKRYSSSTPETIDDKERALASRIMFRLALLVEQVKPKNLVSTNALHTAMQRTPLHEPVYRGTLPANRPFAHQSIYAIRDAHPPNATADPEYPFPVGALKRRLAALQSFHRPLGAATRRVIQEPVHQPVHTVTTHARILAQPPQRNSPPPISNLKIIREWHVGYGATLPLPPGDKPRCWNCATVKSPGWRVIQHDLHHNYKLCNACGLYYTKWGRHRTCQGNNGRPDHYTTE